MNTVTTHLLYLVLLQENSPWQVKQFQEEHREERASQEVITGI